MGFWVNGVYNVDEDYGTKISVMATVQMPSTSDRQIIEANAFGRRANRHIKIYCDTRLQPVSQQINSNEVAYPGDLFEYDGRTYLIFGEADFTMLSRTRPTSVSHYRYYACEWIEGASMENAP